MIRLLTLILTAAPAMADTAHPARLTVGDFVLASHNWDYDSDRFLPAEPGTNTACFEVMKFNAYGVTLALRSGIYHPSWSSQPFGYGHTDIWMGNDKFYLERHPDAPAFELTRGLFTATPNCKAEK